jgi:hypothetical protein
MRAAPALQVTVARYGAWRAFETFVVASACGVLAAWTIGLGVVPGSWGWLAFGAAGAAAVGVAIRKRPPVRLQWDGRGWRVGAPPAADAADLPAGQLRVMLDLGGFLLLRFEPQEPRRDAAASWLPVQRRGLEAHWHALRCAVYSPRPSSASASVDALPPPA